MVEPLQVATRGWLAGTIGIATQGWLFVTFVPGVGSALGLEAGNATDILTLSASTRTSVCPVDVGSPEVLSVDLPSVLLTTVSVGVVCVVMELHGVSTMVGVLGGAAFILSAASAVGPVTLSAARGI